MNTQEIVVKVIDVLEELGVPYMLTGSLANMLYAKPRLTADADFVVVLDRVSIGEIADRLRDHYQFDPQMTFETATATTRFKFRHREMRFSIEFFLLSDSPHDRERFRRRRIERMWDRDVPIPTAEDVVVTKLQWAARANRLKDREDLHQILKRQTPNLDWPYIRGWCAQHGTLELLEEIQVELRG